MGQAKQNTMHAVAINKFGGAENLVSQTVSIPDLGADEVLILIKAAGIGEWDPFEREGGYAEMLNIKPTFPYILGSEGAGTVVEVGEKVRDFKAGDAVYAIGFLNPKGGFYAEYVVVNEGFVSSIPDALTVEQAGVMGGVGITALRGLEDTLKLKKGESVMIFGAGGGIGHVALQLAKIMGARVFAVASGDDGVALAKRLGADVVVNGRDGDVLAAARKFAPDGLDAALLTAGGKEAEQALQAIRNGGRVAYPRGIDPEPQERDSITITQYDGEPNPDIIKRFNKLIKSGKFDVHVAQTFLLDQAADSHRVLESHYLGKLALKVS